MRFDRTFVFSAVADERRQIANLIDSLDDAQLATPSLCTGWDIKTVAAHLVSVFTDSFWLFQSTVPLSGLTDVLVHGGDIKIPLGLPFEPDSQRTALALDFLTGPRQFGFVPLGRLRGICLHGTDIDRDWGTGAEIRGPVAALMMTASGRTALLRLLDGPGLPLLRHRLSC